MTITSSTVTAWAPGRVNLIGEHTDYTGGLALPMAVQLGTRITARLLDGRLMVRSRDAEGVVDVALPIEDPSAVSPSWGRYVAGVAAIMGAEFGMEAEISSTLPLGAGLSSSAALEVATALALGGVAGREAPDAATLASIGQRAEQLATGVPCGVMDQLASAAGVEGCALRLDCATLEITPVRFAPEAQITVVHSGEARTLVGSQYAQRRAQCEAAEALIGPLREATDASVATIRDETLRARARHVVGENARVDQFIEAMARGDLHGAGAVMTASHISLRDDFEVSTPGLDRLVEELLATEGVYGARLTGAGFGGCVVVASSPDHHVIPAGRDGWVVSPSRGAWVEVRGG